MTARTPNEQRIEALEAEVVTMREALEDLTKAVTCQPEGTMWGLGSQPTRMKWYERLMPIRAAANAALSSSADYANKCVVNREEWNQLWIIANDCQFHLNKLDSLRKADEATAAVHIEGGKT